MTELDEVNSTKVAPWPQWLTLGLVLALGLIFVFAHGCHGPDEDHEPGIHHTP